MDGVDVTNRRFVEGNVMEDDVLDDIVRYCTIK